MNPGEIIQALATHPGVVEVVILPVEGATGRRSVRSWKRWAPWIRTGSRDGEPAAATWLQRGRRGDGASARVSPLAKADRKACLALLAGARGSGRAAPSQDEDLATDPGGRAVADRASRIPPLPGWTTPAFPAGSASDSVLARVLAIAAGIAGPNRTPPDAGASTRASGTAASGLDSRST